MKKLLFLLPLVFLSLLSCNNDDDDETTNNSIVGTWKLTSFIEGDNEYPVLICDDEETIVFSENGSYTETQYWNPSGSNCIEDETYFLTYTYENNMLTFTDEEGDTFHNATISNNGNTLTIDYDQDNTDVGIYQRQ